MATLDPTISNIHLIQIEKYWEIVIMTLEEIFEKEPERAYYLKKLVNDLNIEEQWLFYHTEPLYTAADLAGEQKLSDSQIKHYCYRADQTGWHLP